MSNGIKSTLLPQENQIIRTLVNEAADRSRPTNLSQALSDAWDRINSKREVSYKLVPVDSRVYPYDLRFSIVVTSWSQELMIGEIEFTEDASKKNYGFEWTSLLPGFVIKQNKPHQRIKVYLYDVDREYYQVFCK